VEYSRVKGVGRVHVQRLKSDESAFAGPDFLGGLVLAPCRRARAST
jgi:hypothetical protein